MGKGKGTETYTRYDLAQQWMGRPAIHKIGPSGTPNHKGGAFAVRYADNPITGQAAIGEFLRGSIADFNYGEVPEYHGYHREIQLSALATAVAAGHDEIAAMARRLLATGIAYESLMEDIDGRLCAPGTRRGGPWDDSADEARSWLERGRTFGHERKMAGAIEKQTDWMGTAMARDAVLRGLVDRIPRDRSNLPSHLRSPLIVRRYEHGFLAWHPEIVGIGPWWLVAVDNRRPRSSRLVASLSWKDITPHWKKRDDERRRGYDMEGGPWTRAANQFPVVSLGMFIDEVVVGGGEARPDRPTPPLPPPPPPPPSPTSPTPPTLKSDHHVSFRLTDEKISGLAKLRPDNTWVWVRWKRDGDAKWTVAE